MSREIKFRLWDNNAKKWLSEGEKLEDKFIWSFIPELSLKSTMSGVLEQYTGLKDKNGEEIYEGDIVLDYYDGDDAFVVEWDKDTASFRLTGTDGIASVSFDNFYSDKDLEVIGNIHENKELLGGEE